MSDIKVMSEIDMQQHSTGTSILKRAPSWEVDMEVKVGVAFIPL